MPMSSVGVVVPVRDGGRYLGEALESVLAQTAPPREVIVVDDGSVDGSAEVAAGYGEPVRVVEQEPAGIAAALNRGVAECGCKLVAMLDADDLWTPRKLELQGAALAADPTLDAVFGFAEEFISPELSETERARIALPTGASPWRSKATMLARRTLFERVGPFDGRWRVGDFVDWYARAEEAGIRAPILQGVVLRRRLHPGNYGRSDAADRTDYARIARSALRRRRAAAQ
jgi:glycosyltransferase involved in cell wall biosynthesis